MIREYCKLGDTVIFLEPLLQFAYSGVAEVYYRSEYVGICQESLFIHTSTFDEGLAINTVKLEEWSIV